MKPGPMATRRKRILLVYSLVMLIPGIILGYMAYRGILNDQALREKQARQQLESLSEEFFDGLTTALNEVVLIDSSDILNNSENTLIRFTQNPDKEKNILQHDLLYLPEGFVESVHSSSEVDDWEKGWELEFSDNNLPGAQTFYEEILNKSETDSDILEALFASARIRLKQNFDDEAIEVYDSIIQNHSHRNFNALPAISLAFNEIYKVLISRGDTLEANYVQSQLIHSLLQPKTEYYKAQFSFFVNQLNCKDSISQVFQKEKIKTDQTIQIFNEADLLFNGAVTNPFKRFYQQNDQVLTFISYSYPDGLKTGLVLDLIPFIQSRQQELFGVLNDTENIAWRIDENPAWSVNSSEETEWLSFPFPDQLPNWDLKMSVIQLSWISTIMAPGNGFFLLIFIFIILIMLFGLGFTIHILNQELKLNRLKTEFISNVSHELKSPLTSIRQMTEMLNDQRIDTEDQRNDYYGIMLDQSEHLSHLIDNILDFSRMEENSKQYQFEEFDLIPLFNKAVKSFTQNLKEKGFKIVYNSTIDIAVVNADKNAIKQILYNLIDNAVKFSLKEKKIAITLNTSSLGLNNKEICISIQDWGMGISKKDMDKIFDRFYRSSESNKRAIKGSGIGLTLVKLIVEAHNGHIEVESQLGEGSTFKIYLPIKEDSNEKDTSGRR